MNNPSSPDSPDWAELAAALADSVLPYDSALAPRVLTNIS
ncbi:hypothetical protein C1Y40_05320 [Mycobacterium talmoniae]|uniref:Uncharacterized protein n=1 Tax=Mycobacterium talmoniae TaxID=1858794 RepID=A0A2S8BCZ0_9MYCO|nr:hypothetical protein C1Y40_05320 [Mycobacterium talmoniae]